MGIKIEWYHRLGGICILLFLVLGPIALPTLWKSPVLSKQVKISLTVASAAYGLLMLFIVYKLVQFYAQVIDQLSLP